MNRLQKLAAETARIYDESLAAVRSILIKCGMCDKNSSLRRWGFSYWEPHPSTLIPGDIQNDLNHLHCPNCRMNSYTGAGLISLHPQGETILELVTLQGLSPEDLFDDITYNVGRKIA